MQLRQSFLKPQWLGSVKRIISYRFGLICLYQAEETLIPQSSEKIIPYQLPCALCHQTYNCPMQCGLYTVLQGFFDNEALMNCRYRGA